MYLDYYSDVYECAPLEHGGESPGLRISLDHLRRDLSIALFSAYRSESSIGCY
jgi:hypothetical protein